MNRGEWTVVTMLFGLIVLIFAGLLVNFMNEDERRANSCTNLLTLASVSVEGASTYALAGQPQVAVEMLNMAERNINKAKEVCR